MHLLGYREGLDHRAAGREIAVQHGHPAIGTERVRPRADYYVPANLDVVQIAAPFGEEERAVLDFLQVLSQRLAGDGEAVEVQHFPKLEHDSRNAARVPEVLDRVPAGRLDV